jgi:hypothetical protein
MIEHNIIVQNWSQGNGAAMAGCYGTIRNNLIAGNAAELYGGGLYGCGGRIENNTITYNSAALDGGGLYSCDGTIVHCIIWGNTASNGAQLYSSSDPTYSCIQDWVGGGEGNTNNDPLFVDTDGADDDPETYGDNDYHLIDSVASQGEESLFIDTTSLTWDWRKVFYRVDMEEDGSKKL